MSSQDAFLNKENVFAGIRECQTELEAIMTKDGVKGVASFLEGKGEEWRTIPLNIGVIGCSGAGKSSFINAMRDLEGDDEGAAAVGVTEQTTIPTSYPHPQNPMLKLWDLPGVGTPSFPKDSYLDAITFSNYDFFIILASCRFNVLDAWLAEEIQRKGKHFLFARTKLKSDLENDRNARPKSYKTKEKAMEAREETINRIRDDLKKNLGGLYSESTVFLIDCYETGKHQFGDLKQRLIEEFPKIKREALILSMSASTRQGIQTKINALRGSIWVHAVLSGTVATLPVPGVSFATDLSMIANQAKQYWKQLGLDDDSLEKVANSTSTNLEELKAIIQKEIEAKHFLTTQGFKELLVTLPALAFSEIAENWARFMPVLGSFVAAPISAGSTYYILNHILDRMGAVALQVLDIALGNLHARADNDSSDESGEN